VDPLRRFVVVAVAVVVVVVAVVVIINIDFDTNGIVFWHLHNEQYRVVGRQSLDGPGNRLALFGLPQVFFEGQTHHKDGSLGGNHHRENRGTGFGVAVAVAVATGFLFGFCGRR